MKYITTSDFFNWVVVTEESDKFLQDNLGKIYVFHDDESESLISDMVDLSEAIENDYVIVMEKVVYDLLKPEPETQYPIYRKSSAHQFKVLDSETCIQVTDCFGSIAISLVPSKCAYLENITEESTQTEFNTLYKIISKALDHLAIEDKLIDLRKN